jgi:hypothetical protein
MSSAETVITVFNFMTVTGLRFMIVLSLCLVNLVFTTSIHGAPWPLSLRRHLRGQGDPVRRSLQKRVRLQIGLREQRHIGGADRIPERLLRATYWIEQWLQVDAVAMCAHHLRSTLKTRIDFVRRSRLTEIESLCAHMKSNSDVIIVGRSIAAEKDARNCGGARDGPSASDSCSVVHVNLLMNSSLIVRFIDNES